MHCLAVELHNSCLPQSRTYFNIGNEVSNLTLFTSSVYSLVGPMGFFFFFKFEGFLSFMKSRHTYTQYFK